MYRMYKNILHSLQGDFKILVKSDFRRILRLISWSLQDDQGGITNMIWIFSKCLAKIYCYSAYMYMFIKHIFAKHLC